MWATKGLARWSPATPAVAQGRVFVASGERVLCYEAQTGDLVWAYEHSWEGGAWPDVYPYGRGRRAILGSPVVGGERFSPAPGSARGPAGPAHPVVWVACGDGSLVALDAGTGTLRGRHGLGAPIYTTPLPVAGAMVVVDSQGVVHAVAVDTDAVS